ncbi:ABC transporter ATP-binding protein [Oceanobacillus sp. CFH 90083]|uniref:ABC transporter ATP-binding protein n=1 Tax=Oceanobacillus sp. CFH 90083 TaxID=2592336 RepID=UPI00128D8D79|nr:ATP-binding cassette domain-containing protein [Oceanobacillus sp. CFH 90083]
MSVNNALSVSKVDKSFGKTQVLENMEFSVKRGEFIAIVGKSGCGKSTLLRLLAQLDSPTKGEVVIPNGDIIRMMFQDGRLLPWKNIKENVMLGLRHEPKKKALEAIKSVQLEGKENDWPSSLSGGQKQRVALARALVHSPNLLLLDEPLGALDALTRREMQQLIEEIWLERGFSVVLVTHDIDEAVALADRVLVIEKGEVAKSYDITLPRPRKRSSHEFVYLSEKILDQVLGNSRKTEKLVSLAKI